MGCGAPPLAGACAKGTEGSEGGGNAIGPLQGSGAMKNKIPKGWN